MTIQQHVSVKDMARKLQCDAETLRRKLRAGEVPGLKIGNGWRVDPSKVIVALSHSAHLSGGK